MLTSIFTTALLAGSALALPSAKPAAAAAPTCMEKGGQVHEWSVHDFDYHASYIFTTPAHQNSWGYVNFTLSNPALPYKPVCSASSSQLSDFFYGFNNYDCVVPGKYARGDSASFSFDRPTGELSVNQTWSCLEEGGRFTAEGAKKLKLDCTDKTKKNKDWKVGQIYSERTVTCKKVTTKVPVERISAVL